VPGDGRSCANGSAEGNWARRIEGGIRAGKTTNNAAAGMLAVLAGLIALLVYGAARAVVANLSNAQRIGCNDRGRPARGNRRKNLHHQRDQDDRKIFL